MCENKCCCCCGCEPDIEAKIRRGIVCSGESVDIDKITRNPNCTQRWNVWINQSYIDRRVIDSIECASGLKFVYIESNGEYKNLHLIFSEY